MNSSHKYKKISFVFFGTDFFSISVLKELVGAGLIPEIIVTKRDEPKGRKHVLTPPEIKIWAQENLKNTFIIQPSKLRNHYEMAALYKKEFDVFVVASYGKIIPKEILELPTHGTLNVHPSLLPKYRGPSPIEYQILNDEREVGVSIMAIDEEMDHGPIIRQETVQNATPTIAPILAENLAKIGGKILAEVMPLWIQNKIEAKAQNHNNATYTNMIKKEDGLLNIKSGDSRQNYLKYLALQPWPGTYFIVGHNSKQVRVIIKTASFENGLFKIQSVLPEGGHEMNYSDFLRGIKATD